MRYRGAVGGHWQAEAAAGVPPPTFSTMVACPLPNTLPSHGGTSDAVPLPVPTPLRRTPPAACRLNAHSPGSVYPYYPDAGRPPHCWTRTVVQNTPTFPDTTRCPVPRWWLEPDHSGLNPFVVPGEHVRLLRLAPGPTLQRLPPPPTAAFRSLVPRTDHGPLRFEHYLTHTHTITARVLPWWHWPGLHAVPPTFPPLRHTHPPPPPPPASSTPADVPDPLPRGTPAGCGPPPRLTPRTGLGHDTNWRCTHTHPLHFHTPTPYTPPHTFTTHPTHTPPTPHTHPTLRAGFPGCPQLPAWTTQLATFASQCGLQLPVQQLGCDQDRQCPARTAWVVHWCPYPHFPYPCLLHDATCADVTSACLPYIKHFYDINLLTVVTLVGNCVGRTRGRGAKIWAFWVAVPTVRAGIHLPGDDGLTRCL